MQSQDQNSQSRSAIILNRHPGESIIVGEGKERVEITLMESGFKRCVIRVEAPREVRILRGELKDE